jgi:hypothetical protein
MTPQCPKWLPSDEYTRESQLPISEYTGESQLPGSEYIEESQIPCDEYTSESISWYTLNKHQNRFTKKIFLVTNSSGVETPKCIHYRGVLPTWCILPRNTVFVIPQNKVLIPCHSEYFGRVHSVTRNKRERNGIPRKNEV